MTHALPFTQYVRPHGRKRPVQTQVDEDTYKKGMQIIDAGFDLTIEELRDGSVSIAIEGTNMDLDVRICPNGPKVPLTIKEMIEKFDIKQSLETDLNAGEGL